MTEALPRLHVVVVAGVGGGIKREAERQLSLVGVKRPEDTTQITEVHASYEFTAEGKVRRAVREEGGVRGDAYAALDRVNNLDNVRASGLVEVGEPEVGVHDEVVVREAAEPILKRRLRGYGRTRCQPTMPVLSVRRGRAEVPER